MINRFLGLIWLSLLLNACGGGHASSNGGGSSASIIQPPVSSLASASQVNTVSSSSSSAISSAVISSSVASVARVKISGKITYDYVPHNANHRGLNYSLTEKRPVRHAVVELLNDQSSILDITATNNLGDYEFSVFQNSDYKIRVKSQTKSTVAPTWNISVVDNTTADAIYSMVGSLASSGTTNSVRDLNANSGWDSLSSTYVSSRVAAPFAILDSLYTGVLRFQAFGNTNNYPLLVAHWSVKNKAVDGDIALGEISTTYFSGNDIYILGDADSDTDEYDPSPILHEFGHYIEDYFFRSDSIGGNHASSDSLDMRVAMSEGFANAFSGIMLDNPFYEDASDVGQSNGGTFNLSQKPLNNKGYYREITVQSILYNYYLAAGTNKIASDASKIFSVMRNTNYKNAPAFTSIFLFYDQLKQLYPDQQSIFGSLILEQNISGTDQYATNEIDTAGIQKTIPIYKDLVVDNSSAINVCSYPMFGKFNKLGNSAFFKLILSQVGGYTINATKSGGDSVISKPEIVVYQRGQTVGYGKNSQTDMNSLTVNLQADSHIVEIYDANNHDAKNTDNSILCFDVRAVKN